MIAYKCLRAGAVGPYSGFHWPQPKADGSPGAWVEAAVSPCRTGIHACLPQHLPYWLNGELWAIELDGEIVEAGQKLVAGRGRLLHRIDAWEHHLRDAFCRACADRVLARRDAGEPVGGYASDAATFLDGTQTPALITLLAVRAAVLCSGPAAEIAERRWQEAWLAEHLERVRLQAVAERHTRRDASGRKQCCGLP